MGLSKSSWFDAVNVSLLRTMKVAFRARQKNILAENKIRQFKMSASLEFINMPERLRFVATEYNK